MSDPPAEPSGGQVFRAMTTVEMSGDPIGRLALPSRFADLLTPPTRDGDVGTYFGWPIVRVLGRGGMGLVLQSFDQRLRRDVAIKTTHPDLADDPQMAARFAREARGTAQINHPNVITIYSVHEEANQAFLVMELLQGGTLQEVLRERPASEQDCIRMARDVAQGLQAAHDLGLLHRDLKPSNIGFRRPGGQALIMDFGLARALCDTDPLTLHGTPLGTPAFMSPEQVQVKKLDHRSDLFSLGTLMFLTVSGRLPFPGSSPSVICHSITSTPPPSLRDLAPDVSPGLESMIGKLLQKNPSQRYQSAAEVIEALNRLPLTAAPRRKRRLAASALLGLLAAGAGTYWSLNRPAGSVGKPEPVKNALAAADLPRDDLAPPTPAPPAVPEVRDTNGVVWKSTNPEHAGTLGVDGDGSVRLVQSGAGSDNWVMAEASLEETASARRYLLLDIQEVAPPFAVQWAVKLAPKDGTNRDVELTYHHETGRFAIPLSDETHDPSQPAIVRLFVIGSTGALVRFRDVRVAGNIPERYQELSVVPDK